jgi:hypothetical protein
MLGDSAAAVSAMTAAWGCLFAALAGISKKKHRPARELGYPRPAGHSQFQTNAAQGGRASCNAIMTGIGPVAVRAPRIRDRVGTGEERIAFSSAILPPYARRSKSLEVLIPIRYLKGISTGGFERNVPTRGTDAIAVIPTEANCHCFPQRGWRRILRVELAEPRFVADSPPEGAGFEPSVPRTPKGLPF